MQEVKQNTATVVYVYMVDATDGYTPELEATIIPSGVYPTCYISKAGGAATALTLNSGNFAVISDANMPGWYKLTLSASEVDTLGPLGIDVYKSGVSRHFATVVNVVANLAADIKSDTAAILDDTGTSGVVVPTATLNTIADKVWDEAIAGHLATGSTGAKLNSASAAADPWAAELPGSYSGNEAGYKIGRILSGLGASLTTLTVEDSDDNPLEGVTVDFYTSSTPGQATFYTRAITGVNGVASVYLPSGTYYAFRFKRGYSFTDPLTVTVP